MKLIKYFIQFIFIIFLFLLFKILGLKLSKFFSSFIFRIIGPHFRSKKISHFNLTIAFPELDKNEKDKIVKSMWTTYGKIFAEYIFIKDFRQSPKFSKKIIIENQKGWKK
jgi:Lauroyl/myristoyl acyltransferase